MTKARDLANFVSGTNSAITTTQIDDDAVTNAKLADPCVATGNIYDDNVTEPKIGDDAVSAAKLKSLVTLLIINSAGTTVKTLYGAGA